MIAVSDASPLHYLILLGHADSLPAIFKQVPIPPAVLCELQHPDAPVRVRDWLLTLPEWISLQLAHHRQVPVVLLDDFDARRAAERRQLIVAGTLRLLAEGSLAGPAFIARGVWATKADQFSSE